MTVALVDYRYSGQSGEDIQITRTYRVDGIAVGSIETGRAAALAATGIPVMGATATGNVKWFAIEARPLDTRNPDKWEVTAQARTAQPDDDIRLAASGTVIDKGLSADVENVLRDRTPTGSPFLMTPTTGVSWPKRLLINEPRMTAWFEKVHDVFPESAAADLVGAVNSATWNGYGFAEWLCTAVNTYTIRQESGQRYIARYEFAYKPEKWVVLYYDVVWKGFGVSYDLVAKPVTGQLAPYRNANFATYGFVL